MCPAPSPITDASLLDVPDAGSVRREGDGVDLHAVAAGDPADPLVVLLHGFPDFWYSWRHHVGPLVDAGYRVLVPDGRGYNLSGKPDGIRPYRIAALVADAAALVESEGRESAHVVGHDWGATVAWQLALRRPGVVDRLAVANVPHPTVLYEALQRPRQFLRSWYAMFFQLPWLPERVCRGREFAALGRATWGAAPAAFTEADRARYRAAWARPGALTGMLNWYRAVPRYGDAPPRERVEQPTLVLWGDRDAALLPELAAESVDHCEDGRLERFPDASHWVHLERPEETAELLLEHLAG
jgi:pimeloyl-ACP methyl ester carboxylesterase